MTNRYYENAKEKGFHDNDTFGPDGTPDARTRIVFAGLILTEWAEALIDRSIATRWERRNDGKPEGEASEWADVWIRCADTLGACREPLIGREYITRAVNSIDPLAYAVSQAIESARNGDTVAYAALLRGVMNFAASQISTLHDCCVGVPSPSEAIAAKHAYNKTRPRRHGKLA